MTEITIVKADIRLTFKSRWSEEKLSVALVLLPESFVI